MDQRLLHSDKTRTETSKTKHIRPIPTSCSEQTGKTYVRFPMAGVHQFIPELNKKLVRKSKKQILPNLFLILGSKRYNTNI